MAKNENPPLYMLKRGSSLIPEMSVDAELLSRLPTNERIKVMTHTGRSPRRLRFYWAFLGRVVKATGCAPTPEALHSLIKLETGHTTPIKLKGYTVLVPASISFANMTEPEFETFLEGAIEFVARSFGITPEQVFEEKAA